MKWPLLALIIFSVSLSAIAQIVLKTGMTSSAVANVMKLGSPFEVAVQIAISPWVVGGLGLYFLGALVWLFVLARVEVSVAYPFVGLGFILTMIMGKFVMGDDITVTRMVGTLLVAAGVVLIARS
jgi:multidrug transporter EmrE-like cation transporter